MPVVELCLLLRLLRYVMLEEPDVTDYRYSKGMWRN